MNNIEKSIYGFIIGDACGVPFEFRERDTFKCDEMIECNCESFHHVPLGTWSDDTSLMLCTLNALCASQNNIKTDMVFQQIQGINQINDLNNKIPQILGLYDNMNMNHQLLNQDQLMFNQMPGTIPNTNANDNNFNKTNFPSCKTPQQINQYSQFGTMNNSMNQLGMQGMMGMQSQMGQNPNF